MEVENLRSIVKPDRAPDSVLSPGHAIWWQEMIFQHVYGDVWRLEIEDGRLMAMNANGIKRLLPYHVKLIYDEWWTKIFEEKFLGDSDG